MLCICIPGGIELDIDMSNYVDISRQVTGKRNGNGSESGKKQKTQRSGLRDAKRNEQKQKERGKSEIFPQDSAVLSADCITTKKGQEQHATQEAHAFFFYFASLVVMEEARKNIFN